MIIWNNIKGNYNFEESFSYFDGDYELVGEIGCLGLDEKECDLCANIYALGQMADPIENVDLLVPTYIKDVEAKKACY